MFWPWLPVTTCSRAPAGAVTESITQTHSGLSPAVPRQCRAQQLATVQRRRRRVTVRAHYPADTVAADPEGWQRAPIRNVRCSFSGVRVSRVASGLVSESWGMFSEAGLGPREFRPRAVPREATDEFG
jgi:hypothetical protein